MIPTLHINLLGNFQLVSGETPVTSMDLPRLQSLLAYLVLHRTAPQPRSYLAYLLWPDSTDAQALTNLRNLVHKLRQTLPNADAFLHADRQTLQWRLSTQNAPWTLDVLDFEQALAQAEHAQDPAMVRQALAKATQLYRGDLLPSCYDEWILPERDRLRQAFLKALERLIELLEQERDYDAAIRTAQDLLHHDPLHEVTYRHLMRLYAVSDDRASALRTYHTCATVLERELATAPSRATRQAYEQLVQTGATTGESKVARPSLPAVAPLVGRQLEWSQLQSVWRSAAAGRPQMVVLAGEAGIGKTRLAEELLTWVERQGIVTASARCYAAEGGLAYGPVVGWLRTEALHSRLSGLADVWLSEVARLLPDLLLQRPGLPQPGPLTEGWQRQHFFEALTLAVLSDRQPLVLLLDDLQWCDRETLEWLHYLLRFDQQIPLLLVGTLRTEEEVTEHPLSSLLMSLGRDGLITRISLDQLSAAETAYLARHMLGQDLDSTLATELFQETEGNPLFVVETVRTGLLAQHELKNHALVHTPARYGRMLPPSVQAVIAERLAQLSPEARELTSIAAVIGRAFTFAVLAQVSGNDEDTLVRVLDELWQRRIVREQGADAYDFSHDKLREQAYASLSSARRRLLHRRVAEALEGVHADNLDRVSGQLATHYEHAGLLQQAATYYQRTGEVAMLVYAHAEAMASFQRALELMHHTRDDAIERQQRGEVAAHLHERMGHILALTGSYEKARGAYQQALAQAVSQSPIQRARLHRKSAKTWEAQQRYKEALHEYRSAEHTLGEVPVEPTLEWWQECIEIRFDRMWLHFTLVQVREMNELIEQLQPLVEQYGTPRQAAKFFLSVCIRNFRRDRYVISEETLSTAQVALAAAEKSGNVSILADAHIALACCQLWCGDLAEAKKEMATALTLVERTGDVGKQSLCLSYLAIINRKSGHVEETRHYSLRSLAVATAIQRQEHSGAAHANLAWVAWREGNLTETQRQARAALELWQQMPLVYPFQWIALWPLIEIALSQERLPEAVEYARALLGPHQKRLPVAITTALQAAMQAWDGNEPGASVSYLRQAIVLAQKSSYL